MTEAERILQRLRNKTRQLWSQGYETARLLFSDDSYVRATNREPRAIDEVETLLRSGERPLGYVARLSEGRGRPFVEPWETGDKVALDKLNAGAHFWYHHRM
jgi:hypothetical protein